MKLTLLPNHNMIIQKGFNALEKALQFYPIIRNKQCGQCNGSCTQISKANYHIFIELDIRASLHSAAMHCKLKNLPTMLKLTKQYR